MKPLIKRRRKFSFQLKMIIAFLICIGFLSVIFSLKNQKKTFPDLRLSDKIEAPTSSSEGGFYSNEQLVKLTSDPDKQIYYTTDGSEPSLSSFHYDAPIIITDHSTERNRLSLIPTSPRWVPPLGNVFKGTILRAIAVDENNNKSVELVKSFFINEKGDKRYSLPVVSITINEKDMFGYKGGIYVLGKNFGDKDNYVRKNTPLALPWWEYPSNYLLRGENAERPVHIEFYEPGGKLGFQINAGIRINGNATRGYAQKSLRVYFREKYGQAQLHYNLFPANKVNVLNSIVLRNGGNDWDKTMFRDSFMQRLMKDSKLDIQDDVSAVVFINGEYWGIHNIRERFDENYIANKYNCSADSVTVLPLNGKIPSIAKQDKQSFEELLEFVQKNDLSNNENYRYVQSKIDVESFSDLIIANVYFCNNDWPSNNIKLWKYHTSIPSNSIHPKDGRWRWMLNDTDWGFGYNSASVPQNSLLDKATKVGSVGILFNGLLKNKQFEKLFIDRFDRYLNTVFLTNNVIAEIEQYQAQLEPEIQEHINRWRIIPSHDKWLDNIEIMKKFARERPPYQVEQLNAFFNLKSDQQIRIRK